MSAINFNFAHKFLQNGGFSVLHFVFLEENFPTGINPPATMPLETCNAQSVNQSIKTLLYINISRERIGGA